MSLLFKNKLFLFVLVIFFKAGFTSQAGLKLLASAFLVARTTSIDLNWTSNFIDKCAEIMYMKGSN